MSAPLSSGLLLYRRGPSGALEVLLVHMGGPFWQHRDAGAWSIPKGLCEEGEEPLAAARREFAEETGLVPPEGEPVDLGTQRQAGGKLVHAWALAGDLDVSALESNTFTLEWPRRSGRMAQFPEVDRAAWLTLAAAREKLVKGQVAFLDELERRSAA